MKFLRNALHQDPSKWIGLAGSLTTAAVFFTRLTTAQGGAIQHILDGLLLLLVPGTAAAIRTKAYAPATVVEKVTEAATGAVGAVGGTVAATTGTVAGVVTGVLGSVANLGGKR